jgi:uncharacterized membrane protein YsdA (DUF1294 family)
MAIGDLWRQKLLSAENFFGSAGALLSRKTIRHSLLTIRYSPFTTRHSLFAIRCRFPCCPTFTPYPLLPSLPFASPL